MVSGDWCVRGGVPFAFLFSVSIFDIFANRFWHFECAKTTRHGENMRK